MHPGMARRLAEALGQGTVLQCDCRGQQGGEHERWLCSAQGTRALSPYHAIFLVDMDKDYENGGHESS